MTESKDGEDRHDLDDLASSVPGFTASAARILSGLAGPAGSLLAELVTVGIERQRNARLGEFFGYLVDRMNRLEEREQKRRLEDPERVELLERGAIAAARAGSVDRRTYIAELVARGLSSDELRAEEAKKLLAMLELLTGPEVILLRWLSIERQTNEHRLFYEQHKETLEPASGEVGIARSEVDRKALQDSYFANLQSLGLVIQRGPGNIRVASPLGKLLLRHIGVIPEGQ